MIEEQPIFRFPKPAPKSAAMHRCPVCGSHMLEMLSTERPHIGFTGIFRCFDEQEIGCDTCIDPTLPEVRP